MSEVIVFGGVTGLALQPQSGEVMGLIPIGDSEDPFSK